MPLFVTRVPADRVGAEVIVCIEDFTRPSMDAELLYFHAGPALPTALKDAVLRPDKQPVVTPAFALDAQWMVHIRHNEGHLSGALTEECCRRALETAVRLNAASAAFCFSGGTSCLRTAREVCRSFLNDHDLTIHLCTRSTPLLEEGLLKKLSRYLGLFPSERECYTSAGPESSYLQDESIGALQDEDFCPAAPAPLEKPRPLAGRAAGDLSRSTLPAKAAGAKPAAKKRSKVAVPKKEVRATELLVQLQNYLKKNDAGFRDTLLKYIDRTGKKDSEIYKKANIDRRLFSKIINIQGYNPSKPTAIAFAIALELNLEETKDLIGRAGYTLSQASTFDRIIEFFILEENYDIHEINEALFYFDQSLLGC